MEPDIDMRVKTCRSLAEGRDIFEELRPMPAGLEKEELLKSLSRVCCQYMDRYMKQDVNLECLESSWEMINYNKEVFTAEDMMALVILKENRKLVLPSRKKYYQGRR